MNSIYLSQNMIQRSSVDVNAFTIAEEAASASFNLDFDSTKMTYTSFSTGTFFEQQGNHASYSVTLAPGSDHTLVVGVSREGSGSGATRSGIMVTLNFSLISEGTSTLGFSNNHLYGPSGSEIPLAGWSGGDMIISRAMCD